MALKKRKRESAKKPEKVKKTKTWGFGDSTRKTFGTVHEVFDPSTADRESESQRTSLKENIIASCPNRVSPERNKRKSKRR